MHTPVLLTKIIENLEVKVGGRYIDATIGEAGHAVALLQKGAFVLGIDQDPWQIEQLKQSLSSKRLKLVVGNFKNILEIARQNEFDRVDGILFDLGLSMGQISKSGRGFSFEAIKEPLDMRLDPQQPTKASDILHSYSKNELYRVFSENAEEINAAVVAKTIVASRSKKPLRNVGDLIRVINQALGRSDKNCWRRVFQAIRIEVNDEFTNLKIGLSDSVKLIRPDGRIAVLTFHSLEDRIVKQFIKNHQLKQTTKKPMIDETDLPFARSAKLRVFTI